MSVRLPVPGWMAAWPRGLRPTSLRLQPGRLEMAYVRPDGAWTGVRLRFGRGQISADVQRGTIDDPVALSRLCRAVEHHWLASPEAAGWLAAAQGLCDAFAAAADPAALGDYGDLMQLVPEANAARPPARLGPTMVARARELIPEVGVALGVSRMAAGDFLGALDCAALGAPDGSAGAMMCAALLEWMRGKAAGARRFARGAMDAVRDPDDRELLGRLLFHLQEYELLVELLRELAPHSTEARTIQLLALGAVGCHDVAAAEQAWELICAWRDPDAEVVSAVVRALVEVGALEHAEAALGQLVDEGRARPEDRILLANLWLWSRQLVRARTLAEPLLDEVDAPLRARVEEVLGTVAVLEGDYERATELLQAAIDREPLRIPARLWLAEAALRSGAEDDARELLEGAGFADHPAWKLQRALVRSARSPELVLTDSNAFQVRALLRAVFSDDALEADLLTLAGVQSRLERALERLGGNRGAPLTYCEGGRLRLAKLVAPRTQAEQIQHRLGRESVEQVLARFEAAAKAQPEVPFFETYATEVLLWAGEYERAFEQFDRIWQSTRTRWGYVGSGACLVGMGRYRDALARFEEALEYFHAYLDGEASYAYRGEAHLELGDVEAALRDLEFAVEQVPQRVGAWVLLALARARAEDAAGARRALERVGELLPALLWEARQPALGSSELPDDAGQLARIADACRARLGGSRSSSHFTFVVDGELRVTGPLVPWKQVGEGLAGLASDVLTSTVAGRLLGELA